MGVVPECIVEAELCVVKRQLRHIEESCFGLATLLMFLATVAPSHLVKRRPHGFHPATKPHCIHYGYDPCRCAPPDRSAHPTTARSHPKKREATHLSSGDHATLTTESV